MEIGIKLHEYLSLNAAVSPLAAGGIFMVSAPGSAQMPHLLISCAESESVYTLSGSTGLNKTKLRLNAVATVYEPAAQLVKAVNEAVEGWPLHESFVQTVRKVKESEYKDKDTGLVNIAVDFEIYAQQ